MGETHDDEIEIFQLAVEQQLDLFAEGAAADSAVEELILRQVDQRRVREGDAAVAEHDGVVCRGPDQRGLELALGRIVEPHRVGAEVAERVDGGDEGDRQRKCDPGGDEPVQEKAAGSFRHRQN